MSPDIATAPRHFALGAIDLDGTLLGPDLAISAANRAAVADLQRHGAEVVLATGRHFCSALPYARALPGVQWIVSSQGGEIANIDRSRILGQSFFTEDEARRAIHVAKRFGIAFMAYADDGIRSDAYDPAVLAFYAGLSGYTPIPTASDNLLQHRLHKLVWIGESEHLDRLADDPLVVGLGLQTVRTHARLFEVLPLRMTKASGLETLARHLGVAATQVVAFGDADNDLPMFAWAGTSVAMPHGQLSARNSATHIAPAGPAGEALARAIAEVLAANNREAI